MSTIAAGTTSTTALVQTADTTGTLVFQTNGTTNAFNVDTSQNINFVGTGQRITGDFTNATVTNRLSFVTSSTNSTTGIYALPSGTGTAASWQATNANSPTNASKILIATNGSTDVQLVSGVNGTGTYLPLSFYNGGLGRFVIGTSGQFGIGPTATVNYGTSGQVLTSGGASAAPSWSTPATPGIAGDPRTILTSKSVTYAAAPSWVGALSLSATTQLLITNDAATGATYYATVYDSNSDTMGSPVTIVTNLNTSNSCIVSATLISSTSVLIGYVDTSKNFNALVLSISGTTITVGTASTTAITGAVAGAIYSDPAVLGSTYVFYIVTASGTNHYLIACTVSGSTVTSGAMTLAATTVASSIALPIVAYSSTTGFFGWRDSGTVTVKMKGFSVSGTTITVSGTIVNTGFDTGGQASYFDLASGRVFYFFRDNSNNGIYVLCSMSGSTLSISTYRETAYQLTSNRYCILVVSSSLFISGGSANSYSTSVIRDNSGTISASAVTTVTNSGFVTFNIGVASLISGSTIKLLFYGTSGYASASNSIVSDAPSITYENGTVSNTVATAIDGSSVISANNNLVLTGVSRNLVSNGLYYYPAITGTSGTIYPSNTYNTMVKGYTTTGYYQDYSLNFYYTSKSRNDPNSSACQWLMLSSSPNSATVTLYRVQYA
jgi:hypothetical protein